MERPSSYAYSFDGEVFAEALHAAAPPMPLLVDPGANVRYGVEVSPRNSLALLLTTAACQGSNK